MYCPRCGASQAVGSQRCTACGYPFTRRQAARRPAGSRPVPAGTVRARQWERNAVSGRRALTSLAVVLVIGMLLGAGVAALASPSVRSSVTGAITGRLDRSGGPTLSNPAAAAPAEPVSTVAPEPGMAQLVLDPNDMMAFVADYDDDIKPLEVKGVEVTADEVIVSISAYGLNGTYRTQIVAQDGGVELQNGRIDGLLGIAVPVDTLQSRLNQELQSAVARHDARVDSVTLSPGQIIVIYEKTAA